ncbi:unnamed protein product [Periconia digitata]|uniref:Uncharacterized protein n=1 Tax=Periconia digitata TaxID=1303443 RepID=A0A9W4U7S5_9PLEO|nr:unnamed protein product [Periconia digitata]
MVLIVGNRIFALREGDVSISDFLLDPTTQACVLSSSRPSRVLYFAHPLPPSTLNHLTPSELRVLYQHIDGTRYLLFQSVEGDEEDGIRALQYQTGIQARILRKLREQTDETDDLLPEPTMLLVEAPNGDSDPKVIKAWVDGGLGQPFPLQLPVYPEPPLSHIKQGDGYELRNDAMDDPTWDIYFKAIASLSKEDLNRYINGEIEVARNHLGQDSDFHIIPGDGHPHRARYMDWMQKTRVPDTVVRPPSIWKRARPASFSAEKTGTSKVDQNRFPNSELAKENHDTTFDHGGSPGHKAQDDDALGGGCARYTPAEWLLSSSKWPSNVLKFLAFIKTLHPAELGLLAVCDLHVVKGSSEFGYQLATYREPTQTILSRKEWYAIFADYKNDEDYESEQAFKHALDHAADEALPFLFYGLLVERKGIRRSVKGNPQLNMTGQEWRKRFFGRDSKESLREWRESMSDSELHYFYSKISKDGRASEELLETLDPDQPLPLCRCFLADGSESDVGDNPSIDNCLSMNHLNLEHAFLHKDLSDSSVTSLVTFIESLTDFEVNAFLENKLRLGRRSEPGWYLFGDKNIQGRIHEEREVAEELKRYLRGKAKDCGKLKLEWKEDRGGRFAGKSPAKEDQIAEYSEQDSTEPLNGNGAWDIPTEIRTGSDPRNYQDYWCDERAPDAYGKNKAPRSPTEQKKEGLMGELDLPRYREKQVNEFCKSNDIWWPPAGQSFVGSTYDCHIPSYSQPLSLQEEPRSQALHEQRAFDAVNGTNINPDDRTRQFWKGQVAPPHLMEDVVPPRRSRPY